MTQAKQSYNTMQEHSVSASFSSNDNPGQAKQSTQNNLHFLKSFLTEEFITETFDQIESERMAKLIGLCAHFTYWAVFGSFNPMPLDDYHMKQLFISML
jgi:hypothetical protein